VSTYHALYYHLIWGTKYQKPWITANFRGRLHAYLGGLVRTTEGVALEVGGVADHVHVLASLTPHHTLKDFMRDIKRKSSEWVRTDIRLRDFQWQDGYVAFTVSVSQLETVRAYIRNQEEHHKVTTFREEYIEFLTKHGVQFKEEYLL